MGGNGEHVDVDVAALVGGSVQVSTSTPHSTVDAARGAAARARAGDRRMPGNAPSQPGAAVRARKVRMSIAALAVLAVGAGAVIALRPEARPDGVMAPIAGRPVLVRSVPYTQLGLDDATDVDTQLTLPLSSERVVGVQITQVLAPGTARSEGALVLGSGGERWVASGQSYRLVDAVEGTPGWSVDVGFDDTGVAVVDGVALAFSADPQTQQLWVRGWEAPTGVWLYANQLPGMRLVSLGQDRTSVIAQLADTEGNCLVLSMKPADGTVRWSTELGPGCSTRGVISPMRVQGSLAAVERPHQTVLDTRTGEVRYSAARSWVSLLPGDLIATRLTDTQTRILDSEGTVQCDIPARPIVLGSWGVRQAHVVVGWLGQDQSAIAGYDPATGRELWRKTKPGQLLGLVGSELLTLGADGAITAVDTASGTEVWTKPVRVGRDASVRILATDLTQVIIQESSFAGREDVVILHALDVRDGSGRWSHTFTGTPRLVADPANGSVVITTPNAVQMWSLTGRN